MKRLSGALKRRTPIRHISDPIPLFDPFGSPGRIVSHPPGPTIQVSDTPVLDYHSYPDVVDEILYYLPFSDLMRWRMTCREMRVKLDVSRLTLTITPVADSVAPSGKGASSSAAPPDDEASWCLLQVHTGGSQGTTRTGGVLLGGWSCRYRSPGGVLYTDTRHPKLRAARSCKLVRQVDIHGCCPHGSPIPAAFVQEVEAERLHYNGARLRTSTSLLSPPHSRPASSEKFAIRGNLRVDLFPDDNGNYVAGAPLTRLTKKIVLRENWRALPQVVGQHVVQHHAHHHHLLGSETNVPEYIFVLDGSEPEAMLVTSRIPPNASVMYDFSTWRPRLLAVDTPSRKRPPSEFEFTSRIACFVMQAAAVLESGGNISILGLHNVNPYWLDPHYPGDDKVPTPDHPDWHPLAVHLCGSILSFLRASQPQYTSDAWMHQIHLMPRSTNLAEWADFARSIDPKFLVSYPHFCSELEAPP